MEKRKWNYPIEEGFEKEPYPSGRDWTLLVIAERLEALVAIGDALEEVSDLWANTLAFGGQPVGSVDMQQGWKCEQDDMCVLFKGHSGECVNSKVGLRERNDWCFAVNVESGTRCMLRANHDGVCKFLVKVKE